METAVIVAGARTPIGRLAGAFRTLPATYLGTAAISGALERSGVSPDQVDYVVMGQVLQAGCGQNPARTAGIGAGIPLSVPAVTLNKVCLSGLNAVAHAAQLVALGEAEVVVAGGMESMTQAPHLLPGARLGHKFGEITLLDHMQYDGLRDHHTGLDMGTLTETWYDDHEPLSREDQDAFAVRSHQRATMAQEAGTYAAEIVPVSVPQSRGAAAVVDTDEGIRPDTTPEILATLRPAYTPDGTITAATASPISDGASAVVIMSKTKADRLGIPWLAEIGAHGMAAGPDTRFQLTPADATIKALAKEGIGAADVDLIEINEAFAAVALESARALGIDESRVNVNGGAIALGHPIGSSGARIALHLALELGRRGGGVGVAAICGGGGQGEALILRVPRN